MSRQLSAIVAKPRQELHLLMLLVVMSSVNIVSMVGSVFLSNMVFDC